jgi:DNA mismatch endonuclease (patch repair protein)
MADRLTPEARSALMSRIRGKDTKPELAVRRMLHAMGYRFRLHRKDLPGRPDIVFPGRRKVIFVHGCFWHGHEGCRFATRPSTRADFWAAKIDGNRARDARNLASLRDAGWETELLWECEIEGDHGTLAARVSAFLGAAGRANT